MNSLEDMKRPNPILLRSEMAPSYTNCPPRSHIIAEGAGFPRDFTLFPCLPPEIRSQIWRGAFTPRIIKWTRVDDVNTFTVPSKSFPLFDVCQESRNVALLYGEYRNISTGSRTVLFSPQIDYLFFDAVWIGLLASHPIPIVQSRPRDDPLDSILPDLQDIRKIMVHPNFTDERKKPFTMWEKLPNLEQILIGADEKTMGIQNKFLLSTVYDAKMYYTAHVKRNDPEAKVPHIAVGCLGWRGADRICLQHGDEDTRKLVGIFEKHSEMSLHLMNVRDEERIFLQKSFQLNRPKLILNLRPDETQAESLPESSTSNSDITDAQVNDPNPPSYTQSIRDDRPVRDEATTSDVDNAEVEDQSQTTRARRWYNKILRGEIMNLANSPTVVIKQKK